MPIHLLKNIFCTHTEANTFISSASIHVRCNRISPIDIGIEEEKKSLSKTNDEQDIAHGPIQTYFILYFDMKITKRKTMTMKNYIFYLHTCRHMKP